MLLSHFWHMQVEVGAHEKVVLWLLLHEEGASKGVGNFSTLFHHVSQLPRHL